MIRFLCLLWVFTSAVKLTAQPFTCKGDFILAISAAGDSTDFFDVNIDQDGIISFDKFSDQASPYLNGIGYRWTDNYIYGIAVNTKDLYLIDASGKATFLQHIDALEPTKSYNAGDISLDGRYLVLLSGIATNLPWRNEELVLIDLESPDYSTTTIPLTTYSGELVYSLDIAFDPISGALYGFDGLHGRLIKILPSNGFIDDEAYPATQDINLMAAMFFDSFGNLYGYAQHRGQPGIKALYQIDIESGETTLLLEGPVASGSDGCSCPYRLELLKTVLPQKVVSCSEVTYTFVISNASFYTQTDIHFEDVFPSGFEILEVEGNTFSGQISGLNTSQLTIENMSIPSGIDSFKVKVAIGDIDAGIYSNQAFLKNLSPSLGSIEFSNDPATIAFNDSTKLEIFDPGVNVLTEQYLDLCPEDTLYLDVTIPEGIFTYLWNDGTTQPIRQITESGTFEVIVENACELIVRTFIIETVSTDFSLELGDDRAIILGNTVILSPEISSVEDVSYIWKETPGNSITCFDCESQIVSPLENTTYFVTVTDQNGCTKTDAVTVRVEKDYSIFVPNIFSPNGDEVNDTFLIHKKEGVVVKSFLIFNRWGELCYTFKGTTADDSFPGWNGQIKGEDAPSGVYVWTALIQFADGEERHFSGDVMVVH